MVSTATITLPPNPASVGAARRFLAETLAEWGVVGLEETAAQALTELATNAVIHAKSQFAVIVHWAHDVLRVCVEDHSSRLPVPRHYPADATTGRGLAMVSRLCRAWGVETLEHGKSVWFEVTDVSSRRRSASRADQGGELRRRPGSHADHGSAGHRPPGSSDRSPRDCVTRALPLGGLAA